MNNTNEPKDQKPAEASQEKTAPTSSAPHERYVVSHVFTDGTMADLIYSKQLDTVAFAVSKDGKVELHAQLFADRDGNMTANSENARVVLMPSLAVKDLIRVNFVYVASDVADYGTAADLHREVRTFIKKYVVLEDERFYDIAAGYAMMTWVFDRFGTLPYLRVIGEMGTGKSRMLDAIGKLCNRAMIASGSISMASVYRGIDEVQGTLVFDEANFESSDMSDEIVKMLNGGHKKNTPVVRMDKTPQGRMKLVTFKVFGPKVLASREAFTDNALESRCITARMYPLGIVDVGVHLPELFEEEAQVIRNKLLTFRLREYHTIQADEATLGNLKFPRLRQSALALTSVLKIVNDDVLKSALGFLTDYEAEILTSMTTSVLVDVLLCIVRLREFNADVQKTGLVYIGKVADEFNGRFYDDYKERETKTLDTRDGPLVTRGQEVSARKIGAYVKKLHIATARNAEGIYIPLAQEVTKIDRLVRHYQLQPILNKEREAREQFRKDNGFKSDESQQSA